MPRSNKKKKPVVEASDDKTAGADKEITKDCSAQNLIPQEASETEVIAQPAAQKRKHAVDPEIAQKEKKAEKRRRQQERKQNEENEKAEENTKTRMEDKTGSIANAGSSSHKVFISGLPWHVDEALLRTDFSECGEITELKLLRQNEWGEVRSRGMAFLGFSAESGREEALKFNGTDYGGRVIKVNPALEREERAKGDGKGKDDGKGKGKGKSKGKPRAPLGEKPEYCTSILVKSLPSDVTEEDLYAFFKSCGEAGPTNVRIVKSAAEKGLAFVDFDDTTVVDEAIKLNATDLKGTPAHLDYSKPRAHKIQKVF